ncbi:MAG TPA: hypothetical protein VFZ76_17205, partial [Anaerolineales bacterium]
MKPSVRTISAIFLLLIFLAACGRQNSTQVPTAAPAATSTLPPPSIRTTLAPDAENSAGAYLGAWEKENYPAMYALLSARSQEAIAEEAFTALHENFALETALSSLETQI